MKHRKQEEWWRPVVSRATMAVLGIALVWGALKCFSVAADLRADHRNRVEQGQFPRTGRTSRASGAHLPTLIGGVLVTLGGGLVILSVLPLSLMQKIGIGGTSLHDQPDVRTGRMYKF